MIPNTHTSKPLAFIDKVDLLHFNYPESIFGTKRRDLKCGEKLLMASVEGGAEHTNATDHHLWKHKLT